MHDTVVAVIVSWSGRVDAWRRRVRIADDQRCVGTSCRVRKRVGPETVNLKDAGTMVAVAGAIFRQPDPAAEFRKWKAALG